MTSLQKEIDINYDMSDKHFLRVRELEQIINIVTHNLRAPLANISSLCGIVSDILDPGADDFKMALSALRVSAGKLNGVISDFDKVVRAKVESETLKEKIDLLELTNDIKLSLGHLIKDGKATIETSFALQSIFSVKAYIYSIFYNLIQNSIKYRSVDVDPVIMITCDIIEDKVFILFKDNGLGFDLTKHGPEVFGLHSKFHGNTDGKGLGLYMVRSHVQALGGQIELRSEVSKGSEFRVLMPLL